MTTFDATLRAIRSTRLPDQPYVDLVPAFTNACLAEALAAGGRDEWEHAMRLMGGAA